MQDETAIPIQAVALILIVGITHAGVAAAENLHLIGSDKDALGNDMRTIAIDLDNIRSSPSEITVTEIITANSVGVVGYNCSEGEIRHGNTPKEIAKLICDKPSSSKPYGDHVPDWETVHVERTKNGEFKTLFDLNSIFRSGEEVTITSRSSKISRVSVHYDCKGYYKINDKWVTLDLTDHTPNDRPGFISLERKVANKVCQSLR